MHIAVVASSALSHMHPHLAVVRELVDRGHRVTYLVGGHLAHLARPTGADVVGYDSLLPGSAGAGHWPDDDIAGMRMFLDDSIHVLPQVLDALDADRPGIVLYDIGGFAGPVAADRWAVPSAQLSPSIVAWDTYREDMAGVLDPIFASDGGKAYLADFDDWLTGTSLTFDEVPPVLKTADVFVTHAGMGSCTEALWYGVPTVAIPQAVDQPGNAAQLQAIGVGRHLAADPPSPREIRDAILDVTSDSQIRLRLNAIRDELHRVGGPGHAADAVEGAATGRW